MWLASSLIYCDVGHGSCWNRGVGRQLLVDWCHARIGSNQNYCGGCIDPGYGGMAGLYRRERNQELLLHHHRTECDGQEGVHAQPESGGKCAAGKHSAVGYECALRIAGTGEYVAGELSGSEPPPDTFKDDAQALAVGTYGRDGVFHATQLQAKCASKYAPAKPGEAPAGNTAMLTTAK